ncbi:hypothetical protein J2Y66_002674 [Paenarthrobacter nitroguajacolicus]|uniref:hypothetical protein n=1 Tax=Paenarthrobacter nitroguajacolicus TaxID=211146 RepID=UPI002860A5AF|nr:hypothetical protein [Paenarthrobacter nitroguajacolicus]MDR6988170.1 hypothetical protein [Paenarthrobacter nitroguajacolicus]
MEDPTTLAINLTYLGTLGLAVLMFLGLGLIIIITLVVAGVGRLLSIVLLAMVGIFPKKETTPIVQLPPRPARVPVPATGGVGSPASAESPLEDLAYFETGSTAQVQAPVPPTPAAPASAPVRAAKPAAPAAQAAAAPSVAATAKPAEPSVPAAPRRDLLGDVRRRLSGASAAVKDGAWKAKVDPRNLPKPAEVKSVVENQAAHHPILVAATKEPPVLAKDWADAVAEADRRAAARAQAGQPPAIKVTVRDLGEPTSSSPGKTPGPTSPDVSPRPPSAGGLGPGPSTPGSSNSGNGGSAGNSGNGAKKSGPNTSKNGKSPSPIRKGSMSSASRNS